MRKNIFGRNFWHLMTILMIVLVTCLLYSSCNSTADPSSVSSSVSQSSSPAEKSTPSATPTPAKTETQTWSITPPPSPAPTTSPSPTPTTATQAEPTSTQKPQPTTVPTTAQVPTVREELADSGFLNEDFYWIILDEQLKQRITGFSYPADDSDSQIHYDELRYIRLLHYDFEGKVNEGELIVHVSLADEVMEIFHQLYLAKYPLTSVLLVDEFGQSADDTLSMEANNTSAFNYRYVSGTQKLSRHSFGAAIDINPMINPYISGAYISPENGVPYADRSLDFTGKIDHGDLCYQLFIDRGWAWGGDWIYEKDYQHFSKKINQ